LPAESVVVPFVVFFCRIDTPGIVFPSASLTVPCTFVCAIVAAWDAATKVNNMRTLIFIVIIMMRGNTIYFKNCKY